MKVRTLLVAMLCLFAAAAHAETVTGKLNAVNGVALNGTVQFKLSQAATAGNPPSAPVLTVVSGGSLSAGTMCMEIQGVATGPLYSTLGGETCVTVTASSCLDVSWTSPHYGEFLTFFSSSSGTEANYFTDSSPVMTGGVYTGTLCSTSGSTSGSPFSATLPTIYLGPALPTTCSVTSGAIAGSCNVAGNNFLKPDNTYYTVTGTDANNRVVFGPAAYQINDDAAGTVDLATLPIVQTTLPYNSGPIGPEGPAGTAGATCSVPIGSVSASALALADDDDDPDVCFNPPITGAPTLKILAVYCWAPVTSPMPIVRPIITGGTSTSILTGDLTCGNAIGGAAGTISGTPTQTPGQALDLNITTAGGSATYLVITVVRAAE